MVSGSLLFITSSYFHQCKMLNYWGEIICKDQCLYIPLCNTTETGLRCMLLPTFKTGIIPEQFGLGVFYYMQTFWKQVHELFKQLSSYLHSRKARLKWYKAKHQFLQDPNKGIWGMIVDDWWLRSQQRHVGFHHSLEIAYLENLS